MQTENTSLAKESTENIILQTAMNLFLIKGYDGTRMQDIADKAELNKALLHYYFKSKEELFKKVLEQHMARFVSMISSSIFSDQGTEQILSEISAKHKTFHQDKSGLPLFILNTMHKHPLMVIEALDKTNIRHLTHALMGHKVSQTNLTEREVLVWFMSFISLNLMPLVGKDLFKYILNVNEKEYDELRTDQSIFAVQLLEK